MLFRSDRKSTRLNSSHTIISYAVFCLKKKDKELSARDGGGVGAGGAYGLSDALRVASTDGLVCRHPDHRVVRAAGPDGLFFYNGGGPPSPHSLPLQAALPV